MLLTLLPLAGWAEEQFSAEKTIVAVSKIEYKQSAAPTIKVSHEGIALEEGSSKDYTVDGYVAEQSATAPTIALSNLQVGQTYYVRVSGVGVYAGKAYGAFTVEKATLKVTIDGSFTQPYKTGAVYNLKADHSDVTVKWGTTTVTTADYVTFGTDYDYSPKYDANKAAGTYAINFTGVTPKDDNNFKVEYEAKNLEINKASINGGVGTWTITRTAASYNPTTKFTYTATAQKPTYTVEWDHDGNASTAKIALVEGTDFNVTYKKGGSVVAADKVIPAGDYTIAIVGAGNYKSTVDNPSSTDFTINKAPLTVMTLPQTKNYDGTAFDLSTAKFNIAGRVGGDASLTVTGLAATGSLAAGQGDYAVNVDASAAKIGTGATAVSLGDNYEISTVAINWTINKRPVTLTVPNSNMIKGAAAFPDISGALAATAIEKGFGGTPVAVVGETGAINETDQAGIAACYERAWANGTGEPLKDVTTSNIETKTYANAIKANVKSSLTSEQEALLANYKVTVVKGSLIVGGEAFTVIPVVESDIEYGDTYTIGYYAYKTSDASKVATIDATKLVFVINGTEYPYAAQIANLPTARGNYNVTIKAGTAIGTGDFNDGAATVNASAFTIVKKKLTVVVKNQKVFKNDIEADFLAGLAADNSNVTVTGVKAGETLSFVYTLAGITVPTTGANKGKITSDAGAYTNAILVALKAGDAVNANYEIPETYTKGTLTVSTDYELDLAAADAATTIATAAGNAGEYDVTISGRTLNGGAWNVMVLPFAVKPLDFCNTIGTYAVFNRLNKVEKDAEGDALKDKIYFKLVLDEIPANEPFLVKPLEAVDFDLTWDDDDNDATPEVKKHVFNGVTFVDAEPTYTGVAGANFIGTYAASAPTSADFWALQGGAFKYFSSAKTIKFTRAYIELTSGASAAEFFVEDIDNNGVTAIKSLNLDTMKSVDMNGWYTIGGVKLQGAPVEKGVYINNGKKVVIK